MSQTLTDLWNGNIAPSEHCGAHDPLVRELFHLTEKNRKTLFEGLTAAQTEICQKYIDCSEEYMFRMLELAFCDGFSLGSKLAMEALL